MVLCLINSLERTLFLGITNYIMNRHSLGEKGFYVPSNVIIFFFFQMIRENGTRDIVKKCFSHRNNGVSILLTHGEDAVLWLGIRTNF